MASEEEQFKFDSDETIDSDETFVDETKNEELDSCAASSQDAAASCCSSNEFKKNAQEQHLHEDDNQELTDEEEENPLVEESLPSVDDEFLSSFNEEQPAIVIPSMIQYMKTHHLQNAACILELFMNEGYNKFRFKYNDVRVIKTHNRLLKKYKKIQKKNAYLKEKLERYRNDFDSDTP